MNNPIVVKIIPKSTYGSWMYPIIIQLNPWMEEALFLSRLREVASFPHFEMISAFDGDKLVGLSGYWIASRLYSGFYLEPDNVIIDQHYRSQGIGKLMMDFLESIAKEKGCKMMMLDAYIVNTAGHKFYEREGFVAKGYHFIKEL